MIKQIKLIKFQLLISVSLLTGCASQSGGQAQLEQNNPRTIIGHINQGSQKLADGNPLNALSELNKAAKQCSLKYADNEQHVYTSRTQAESLYYLVKAAHDGNPAIVEPIDCSHVQYLIAYTNIELERWAPAKQNLEAALEMAPVNAMYLSELGHYYQEKRQWVKALSYFESAEKYAAIYSPKDVKNSELARAKRGMGFSLIELGELHSAQNKYKECVELDSTDKNAKHELIYIEKLLKEQHI